MATQLQIISDISDGLIAAGKAIPPSIIEGNLLLILSEFSAIVAADARFRGRMQRTFTLTLGNSGTAGQEPMPAALLHTPEAIGNFVVTLDGVTNPLEYLPQRLDLLAPPSSLTDFYYYTIHGDAVVVRDATGAIPGETALTILGSYEAQTVAEIPDLLVGDFVQAAIDWHLMNPPAQAA